MYLTNKMNYMVDYLDLENTLKIVGIVLEITLVLVILGKLKITLLVLILIKRMDCNFMEVMMDKN